MNIAILGSAGQIGAYLSDYLKDKGHNVTDVDIVNGVQYDLRVTPSTIIEKAIESADFVFFLAFDVGGSRYIIILCMILFHICIHTLMKKIYILT